MSAQRPEAISSEGADTRRQDTRETPGQSVALRADVDPVEERLRMREIAVRRQLQDAELMMETSRAVLLACRVVAGGPRPSEDPDSLGTPFAGAILALRGVNADRETLAGALKSAVDAMARGMKIEQELLGMRDGAPAAASADSPAPGHMMSAEQLVAICSAELEVLEALGRASAAASKVRPMTINGKVE